MRGYRVVRAGRVFRVPLIERSDAMDLTPIEVDSWIRGAYTKGGVPVDVRFRARVEIARDEHLVGNAVERFLGRDHEEIGRVARETLEGALRGIAAQLTVDELREDSQKVAAYLGAEAEDDLAKLGLAMQTLHLLDVESR